MALLSTFANLLIVWLNESQSLLCLLLNSFCGKTFFWLKFVQKIQKGRTLEGTLGFPGVLRPHREALCLRSYKQFETTEAWSIRCSETEHTLSRASLVISPYCEDGSGLPRKIEQEDAKQNKKFAVM